MSPVRGTELAADKRGTGERRDVVEDSLLSACMDSSIKLLVVHIQLGQSCQVLANSMCEIHHKCHIN